MASCQVGRWLTLRCLHSCLIGALLLGAGTRFAVAQAVTELRAAISPAPLPLALREFSRQTTIQVMYLSALAEGRASKGAAAGLSTRDALASLLEGTGLRYEFLNARSLRLLAAPDNSAAAAGDEYRPTLYPLATPRLEEVIVSATKRDEPLHDVAMSALVLSGQELAVAGITSLADIAARTPGMQFDLGSQFGSGIMSNLVIRGISADRGTAPTIGLYIDDVPIQAVRISLYKTQPLTFDLARVEVLRGPQGTLFGSNAVAGAIRYVSNEASTTESSQWYRAELSDIDHGGVGTEVSAVVDGPLQSGVVGARASVWLRRDGGYVDRISPLSGMTLDADANRSDSRVLRLGMVWTPNERVRVTPSFHHQSLQLHDTPMFFIATQGAIPAPPFSASLLQNGKMVRQSYDDRFSIGSLKVQWDLAGMNFTSVSALFDRDASTVVDQTNEGCLFLYIECDNPLGPAFPSSYSYAIFDAIHIHQRTFSQELRLSSDSGNARFSWLAGLFYYRSHTHRYDDAFYDSLAPKRFQRSDDFVSSSYLDGFATAAFALNTRWSIGAGTRFGWAAGSFSSYKDDYLDGSSSSSISSGPAQAVPTSPRFELTYRPSARNFYYASAARGSRPGGGGETRQCNGVPLPERLDPDVLWSYELGSKNILFDGRLQLDASVYHAHWRDLHVHVYDTCDNSFILNGGLAVSRGFDLTGEWRTDRLAVGLALGYVDIRYRKTVFNETGQVVAERGAIVGGLPEVPAPWNGSLSVQYRWPMASGYVAWLRAEGLFTSRNPGPFMRDNPYAAYFVAASAQADPSTSRLNIGFGLTRSSMEYRLGLDNALNSRPTLHATSDAAGSNLSYAYTFPPRTVRVSVAHRR